MMTQTLTVEKSLNKTFYHISAVYSAAMLFMAQQPRFHWTKRHARNERVFPRNIEYPTISWPFQKVASGGYLPSREAAR